MVRDYKAPRRSNDNPVAQARIKKGITQEQLANMIGVDKRQISAWELGRFMPSVSTLQRIADALDMDLVELVKAQPDKKKCSPIALIRREKGMSQGQLAKAVGVSQGLISTYETGANTPGPEVLQAIANALGVQVSDISATEPVEGPI